MTAPAEVTPLVRMAARLAECARRPIPPEVRAAAVRTLGNVLATAVGAAHEPAVDIAVDALATGTARVPGRHERLAPLDAALVTGLAAHLDDYDDTHLATVIHPGAVCLSALVAVAHDAGGYAADEVLDAVAWGVEVQLRLGLSISPEHYDRGWHITGTCGAAGAATTAGLLMGLDGLGLARALGWAVSDGVGHREAFGSMTKAFHVGRAAVTGVRAAREAARSDLEPEDSLSGPDGLAARCAGGALDLGALLDDLGSRFELLANTFKPYPCGIVSHPAIEAAEALAGPLAARGGPAAAESVRLRCHPLVPDLTGAPSPTDGLAARFSTVHGIAAGLLVPGAVGPRGYTDELVISPDAVRLRSITVLDASDDVARDAAHLEIRTRAGGTLRHTVTHARGSLARPLSDDELREKSAGLVDPVLGPGRGDGLQAAVRAEGARYLDRILEAAVAAPPAPGPSTRTGAGRQAEETTTGDTTLEEGVVRELLEEDTTPVPDDVAAAAKAVDALPRTGRRATEPRSRAEEVAAALYDDGHAVTVAAAIAGAVAADGDRRDVAAAARRALAATGRVVSLAAVEPESLAVLTVAMAWSAAAGLPPGRVLGAVGIAATQVTGVQGGSPGARRRLRRAARGGVESGLLAARGFTGARRPLGGRRGLVSVLTAR